ncbi:aldehyde dehydrogenase family protein [Sphingopyxis sp.]|uniref:aldehyde dehydrogenase family protein n=1 Tax=Sphingopyxis sp. TaxID=1908224 RepID=UPI003D14085F
MSIDVHNWIGAAERPSPGTPRIERHSPHDGRLLSTMPDSSVADVERAVQSAVDALTAWSAVTPVQRGNLIYGFAAALRREAETLAAIVAEETGKPIQDARGEVGGAIQLADFFAGEGMRLYARTLTSGMPGKTSHTVRQPIGVAGLIVPANTPIANIAWKTFPALICGNTVVLKASEDAPRTADFFAKLASASGIVGGVLNVIYGSGATTGTALVADARVGVVSFTGSTGVGRKIAEVMGRRLGRLSLELGGKNPMVVCDDADLDRAVHWAALSAFSNAGQRCAAGSRIIVMDAIYDRFREALVARARSLTLGVHEGADLGPVMHKRQQATILAAIARANDDGATILCGGSSAPTDQPADGAYVAPTLVEVPSHDLDIAQRELFGPVATLHRVGDLAEALELANSTEYGLTAAIHTRDVDRANWFAHRVRAGVVNVNIGTYGSEPHMPFGGFGASGNGTREPGVEALDVYSELKNISFLTRSELI